MEKIEDELVSIIMPSHNSENFIIDSINSVISQTYQNWELLIVDDFSTDKSLEIIKSFDDKRIKVFQNKENLGAAVSRNIALENAKGKWIAFLDSDDLWKKEKLEKQISFMKKNNYDFSYTKYSIISEQDTQIEYEVTGPKKISKHKMFSSCYIGCLTAMYNQEKVGKIQIKDIKKRNDYAIWLKVIKKVDCFLLDENLATYRRNNNSISSGSKFKLIKYHFQLFKNNEKMNFISALWYTFLNLFFGIIRKIKYKKRIK